MKILCLAGCMAAALLSGCQIMTQPHSHPDIPVPAPRPLPVAAQQQALWMEGVLQQSAPLPLATLRADSDRVTLSWDGDAVELLSALARARGQTFSFTGVRLPLPVNLSVTGVTYANLLRLIEMQTAWRATLTNHPGQMVLQFMQTIPSEPGRYKKGGRK